jgi:hypothetical protein
MFEILEEPLLWGDIIFSCSSALCAAVKKAVKKEFEAVFFWRCGWSLNAGVTSYILVDVGASDSSV